MGLETVIGVLLVAVGGLIMGAGAWPMKLMRTFQFEHWWFLFILIGFVLGPWTVTLVVFPQVFEALRDPVLQGALVKANVLALCWGVANILCGLCYVRIGIALTQAILSGLGASVVVLTPMVFKASGQFKDAPDVMSRSGAIVLLGVGVMLVAVVLAALAGFGRDRVLKKLQSTSGSFLVGLIMTIVAGFTSAGLWLAFDYCQGPIRSRICIVEAGTKITLTVADDEKVDAKHAIAAERKNSRKSLTGDYAVGENGAIELPGAGSVNIAGLTAKSAADRIAGVLKLPQPEGDEGVKLTTPSSLSILPVWALGAFSGALLNLLYPAYFMTRRRSWGTLLTNWKEFGLAAIMGFQTLLALVLPGKGMLLLGALGAAIGGGIQQAMQMAGGQGTGFISGEWRGVRGKPRLQIYASIALLILASIIMAIAKRF